MSITQGLFSDVLANAPQAYGPAGASGGSADWSRTLPMAGAVDWANVKPFQVINPLTGYNFGATQPTQASSSSAQEDKPQLSEYQKWLAQQSESKTSGGSDGGGGGVRGYQGTWTDKDWNDLKQIRDELGWGNDVDVAGFKGLGAGILGLATGNFPSAMGYMYNQGKEGDAALRQYQAAMNSGLTLPNYNQIVSDMAVNGQGGFMAQPQPNATMSEAEQRAQYAAGVQAAREAEARAAAEAAAAAASAGSAGSNAPSGGYTGGGGYSAGTGGYGKPGEAGGGFATGGGW